MSAYSALDQAPRPAIDGAAQVRFHAQGIQRGGVGDAQAAQGCIHRCSRAGDLAETQVKGVVGQGFQLGADLGRGDRFGHGLHGQQGRVGGQRRHRKGDRTQAAEQACRGQRDRFGVSCLEVGGRLAVTFEKIQRKPCDRRSLSRTQAAPSAVPHGRSTAAPVGQTAKGRRLEYGAAAASLAMGGQPASECGPV